MADAPSAPFPEILPALPHPREVRRALRVSPLIDSFLCCRFSFSPYMACGHGCRYCDGRAERYWVEGDFERDIVVRSNLPGLLAAELAKLRERAPVGIGSGITDAYQPLERVEGLTRRCAEVLAEHKLPVSLLTKSSLAARDLDAWKAVHRRAGFILQVSIATLDESVRRRFEPGASPIGERLEMLRLFRSAGIPVGVMAMPLLPFISDGEADMGALVGACVDAGASFVMPAGLTLRPGRQKDFYLRAIGDAYPGLVDRYRAVYAEERVSGAATLRYRKELTRRCGAAVQEAGVPFLRPHALYRGTMPVYDELHLLLQHMGELYAARGIAVAPLRDAADRYAGWLRRRKLVFNRHRTQAQRDVEEDTRALFLSGAAAELMGNEKLAAFLGEIVAERKVLDYATLKLVTAPA